jgi:spore coat polysaccharide biosynthesis predicted glycosyltransferase SpsG
MNFFFRTNFNEKIGLGNLFRCLRLIRYFETQKHSCYLFTDLLKKKFLFLKNFNVIPIYKKKVHFFDQKRDIIQFRRATKNLKKGIVIIDDYRISVDWEKHISKFHKKIAVIDDLNKKHYSDYIINYNPSFDLTGNFNYKNVLKKNCKILLGHKFSILEKKKKRKKSKNFNVIMYNGSGGDLIFFEKIIKFFLLKKEKLHKKDVIFKVVIGPFSKNKERILNFSKKNKQIIPILNCYNLNDILFDANLFVGSAGVSSFETALNKVPSILFQVNNNQKVQSKYMEKIGHFIILKLKDLYDYKKISQLILLAKLQYRRFLYLSKTREFLVDFKGTKRILENITKKNISQRINNKANKKLIENQYIRKVNDKDINHYLYSRNLKLNRNHSTTLKKITPIDHYNWWFITKRISYALIKNNKRILYFYHENIFSDKTYNYVLSGWFACQSNCEIREILYALNWQKNMKLDVVNSKQKIMWLSTIKNNNKFSMKLSKYIGWKRLSEKNSRSKILKKYYNINKGYVYYSR